MLKSATHVALVLTFFCNSGRDQRAKLDFTKCLQVRLWGKIPSMLHFSCSKEESNSLHSGQGEISLF